MKNGDEKKMKIIMSFEIFPRYSDHFEKKLNPTGAALTEKVD